MKTKLKKSITILPELKQFISPLDGEAFKQLEENVLTHGCRDALIVWRKGSQDILVDGHHRFEICTQHELPFKVEVMTFADVEEVKRWMIDNQLGRRNLRSDQLSYYRGLKYLAQKQDRGGYDKVRNRGTKGLETSQLLGDEFGVSDSTIKRDAKFATGLDLIGKSNPKLRRDILNGEIKVKKSDIQIFAEADPKTRVQNVQDLKHKVDVIRGQLLEAMDKSLDKMSNVPEVKEPVFLEKDQQITKIKGKILSVLNKAIKEEDPQVLTEIKSLIERLEGLLG